MHKNIRGIKVEIVGGLIIQVNPVYKLSVIFNGSFGRKKGQLIIGTVWYCSPSQEL